MQKTREHKRPESSASSEHLLIRLLLQRDKPGQLRGGKLARAEVADEELLLLLRLEMGKVKLLRPQL